MLPELLFRASEMSAWTPYHSAQTIHGVSLVDYSSNVLSLYYSVKQLNHEVVADQASNTNQF
jgi:hypothetical protein